MTSLTSSCELFTRSHAGHISKLTEVFQYLYLLNGGMTQNVLANVMNIESDGLELDKQTILRDGIALRSILILAKIEMTIVEVNVLCMCDTT